MRSTWLAERAPTFFAVIAEGAWLSVLYVAVQSLAKADDQPLGVVAIAATVGLGVLLARWVEDREHAPILLGAALLTAGVAGVLASASARAQLGEGPAAVFTAHAGGLILVVALIRGFSHRDTADAEAVVDRLLRWGALSLVVPWAIGLGLKQPAHDAFIEGAFGGTVIFVGAGLVSLAAARLRRLGDEAGFDWRAGRAWLGTMAIVVVALVLIMIPSAFILGAPVSTAIREVLAPIVILLWSIPVAAGTIVAFLLSPLLGIFGPILTRLLTSFSSMVANEPPPTGSQASAEPSASALDWFMGGVIIVLVIVAAWLIRRLARRRSHLRAPRLDDPSDRRRMVIPISLPRFGGLHVRLPGVHRDPNDAVTAYLRLLTDAAADPDLTRVATETPHDHALRLRKSGRTGLALDLLAADYELARFGGAE
ncbi:MAG: hypothetical protein ABIZ34_02750, partial [Candidatus Limnocylindrales bacterium]